jgi:regulator of cell morphogenesis and NO signaling
MKVATTSKTVREFALKLPGATWVFEKLGVDCCRGSGRERGEARQNGGVAEEKVVAQEASEAATCPEGERDWSTAPLSALTSYIVTKHHKFTREELPRLIQLHVKVCSVDGQHHPELVRIHSILHELQQELTSQMLKEEQILFPYIEQLEEAAGRGKPVPTPFPCGTLRNPIESMRQENEQTEQALRRLREISSNYAVPADASISLRTLYEALEYFEKDLHQHIHLENAIVFPRAAELEGLTRTSSNQREQ